VRRGGQQQQHSSSSDFRRPFSDAGNSDDVDTVCRDLSDLDVVPADESNVGSLKDDTGSQFDDTSSVAGQEDDGGVAEQGHVADGTAALTDYLPDANTSTDIVNGYSTPTRGRYCCGFVFLCFSIIAQPCYLGHLEVY
jgi:hypothetical protein